MNRIGRILRVGAVAVIGVLVACGDNTITDPIEQPGQQPAVATVEVSPGEIAILPGQSTRLSAVVKAANGQPLVGRVITWSSTDSTVATVSSLGMVNGLASGKTFIRAVVEGRAGSSTVTVNEPPVEPSAPQLSHITPSSAPVGSAEVQLVAVGVNFASDAVILWNGNAKTTTRVSETELRVTLGSDDLSTQGSFQVSVRNPGSGATTGVVMFEVLRAQAASVTMEPQSVVLETGAQVRLTATAYTEGGQPIPGVQFVWSSFGPAIASVDALGKVTAHTIGVTQVNAEVDGRAAQARIEVVAATKAVAINPMTSAVLVGTQVQLGATPVGSNGLPLLGRTITWSSLDPDIASVDASGLVLGLAKGTARIRATVEGVFQTATVEVRQLSTGPSQAYAYRGVVGVPYAPTVGTTTWVDETGVSHEASLVLTGGAMTIWMGESRYEQTLTLSLAVNGRGFVSTTQWTSGGAFTYGWSDGTYTFTPANNDPPMRGWTAGPGELHIEQIVGAAPQLRYSWTVE